VKSSIMRKNL
ncbi:N-acetylmuramoyl-L-alanine amidase domain protein, partial [Chlamydia psittaci 84-8471/1]